MVSTNQCSLPYFALRSPRRRSVALALGLLFTAAIPGPARSQLLAARASSIPDPVACASCRITARVVARLGDVDGPGAIPGPPSAIVADAAGRFVVAFSWPIPPMVFASDGAFLREIGRMGSGPGEYQRPWIVVAAGDSIAVFDLEGRVTVVGPDLTTMARTVPLLDPQIEEVLVHEWPHRVLINGNGRGPDSVGWPLHFVDLSQLTGRVMSSIGLNAGEVRPNATRFLRQHLAQGQDSTFWAIDHYLTFQFARWRWNGEARDVFVRDATWLPDDKSEAAQGLGGGPTSPPSPHIIAIHQDPSGLVWIYGRVPNPAWREAWVLVRSRAGDPPRLNARFGEVGPQYSPSPWHLYETLVEVIDPAAQRVLARQTLPGYATHVIEDGRVVVYRETEGHIPFLEVVAISIDDRSAPTGTTPR